MTENSIDGIEVIKEAMTSSCWLLEELELGPNESPAGHAEANEVMGAKETFKPEGFAVTEFVETLGD